MPECLMGFVLTSALGPDRHEEDDLDSFGYHRVIDQNRQDALSETEQPTDSPLLWAPLAQTSLCDPHKISSAQVAAIAVFVTSN